VAPVLVTTFLAVTVTVTRCSPGISTMCPVNEAVPDTVTVIDVLAPGASVPALGLTAMFPPPLLTAADQVTLEP
jgi:hypothetical protein